MKIDHTCKHCKKPMTVTAPDCITTELLDLCSRKFLPAVVCDRCADYLRRENRLSQVIRKVCQTVCFLPSKEDEKKTALVKAEVRLTKLTKKYAENIGNFYRGQTIWQMDFVAEIMDKPERYEFILTTFKSMAIDLYKKNAT